MLIAPTQDHNAPYRAGYEKGTAMAVAHFLLDGGVLVQGVVAVAVGLVEPDVVAQRGGCPGVVARSLVNAVKLLLAGRLVQPDKDLRPPRPK